MVPTNNHQPHLKKTDRSIPTEYPPHYHAALVGKRLNNGYKEEGPFFQGNESQETDPWMPLQTGPGCTRRQASVNCAGTEQ